LSGHDNQGQERLDRGPARPYFFCVLQAKGNRNLAAEKLSEWLVS
jgi:hypothetical protein